MKEMPKLKTHEKKFLTKAAKWIAAPLTAGVMLISGNALAKKKGTDIFQIEGPVISCHVKNECMHRVKKGDSLFRLTDSGKTFLMELKTTDVDEKGVAFEFKMEFFMSETIHGKFRINYNGTRTEFPQMGLLKDWKSWNVEKTTDPKVAKVVLPLAFSQPAREKKETRIVRAGEFVPIGNTKFSASTFGLQLTKVDDKGVEFVPLESVFMSDFPTAPKVRINYGEERRIGELALWFSVKARKAEKPGSAVLEITHTLDYSEMKRTASAKLNPTKKTCNVPSNPNAGDVIPVCARKMDLFGITKAPFDTAVQHRLDEVRGKYKYLKIEPSVEKGVIRGLFVTTSLYGSGDTLMVDWFDYVATGVKPK